MRYLGIDYGHRKAGLALSDQAGDFSYPYSVEKTDDKLIRIIIEICRKEGVEEIVIGDTRGLKGEENSVTKQAESFAGELRKETGLLVTLHSEVFTSREAERIIGNDIMRDARAGAIMLQSYLDQKKSGKN